jgi:hypothetical protein
MILPGVIPQDSHIEIAFDKLILSEQTFPKLGVSLNSCLVTLAEYFIYLLIENDRFSAAKNVAINLLFFSTKIV